MEFKDGAKFKTATGEVVELVVRSPGGSYLRTKDGEFVASAIGGDFAVLARVMGLTEYVEPVSFTVEVQNNSPERHTWTEWRPLGQGMAIFLEHDWIKHLDKNQLIAVTITQGVKP